MWLARIFKEIITKLVKSNVTVCDIVCDNAEVDVCMTKLFNGELPGYYNTTNNEYKASFMIGLLRCVCHTLDLALMDYIKKRDLKDKLTKYLKTHQTTSKLVSTHCEVWPHCMCPDLPLSEKFDHQVTILATYEIGIVFCHVNSVYKLDHFINKLFWRHIGTFTLMNCVRNEPNELEINSPDVWQLFFFIQF